MNESQPEIHFDMLISQREDQSDLRRSDARQ